MEAALVTIGIPTRDRPSLALEAVRSALAQGHAPCEVLVSDDSADARTEDRLAPLISSGRIRYRRNAPPLGQAGNVNALLSAASGELFVLLHDDDLLEPDAVETLHRAWEDNPGLVACYGRQIVIDAHGQALDRCSEELNSSYERTAQQAGRQLSSLRCALVGQFPNDGYMVSTRPARLTGYRDLPAVGPACDYDFGLRLARNPGAFFFVDRPVARYRLTGPSVGGSNDYAHLVYGLIREFYLPPELEPVRRARLGAYAAAAVSASLKHGLRDEARRIYLSGDYPARLGSLRGILHGVLLLLPARLASPLLALMRRLAGRQ
jgi:glycosyltransferase involved in cell wall biosynthesis